jgi:acyl-homoserine lactone acylase PvdQ
VFADTDEGAMFGLGYASAEDRYFQMCFNRLVMQGRVAEVFGDLGGEGGVLQNDRQMRTLGAYRAAQTIVGNLDEPTRQLLQAFSDGVNHYTAANKARLHPLFETYHFVPEPWAPADSIVAWWHLLGGFWGVGGTLDREIPRRRGADGRERTIHLDEDAAVVKRRDVSERWVEALHRFVEENGLEPYQMSGSSVWEGPKFSHGWALGGTITESGSSLLVGDPQLPIRNPSFWYEFHVSGKTLHARGIGFPGAPGIMVGFTPGVAWTVTALAADQSDLFVLEIHPDNPDQYLLDGQWRDMDVRMETIHVRGAEPISLKVRETVFGPVVSEYIDGLKPGEGVAERRVPLDDLKRDTVQAHFGMMRARSVEDFLRAARDWRYLNVNCVFADSAGNVGYTILGAFPLLPPGPANQGELPLDGTHSANNWRGTIPYELLPRVVNPGEGFVVTANDRPIQSFYPLRLGLAAGGETLRGLRIKQRIREHLDQGKKFRFEDNLQVQNDSVSPMIKLLLRMGYHLRDTRKAELPAQTLDALAYLEPWYEDGARLDWTSPGMELAAEIRLNFREGNHPVAWIYGGGHPGTGLFVKTITARLDENPQAALQPEEQEFVAKVLSDAWTAAVDKYGDQPDQWREKASHNRVGERLGYMVNNNGFPSLAPQWDVVAPLLPVVAGTLAQPSQSYTQVVDLSDPDASLSLLPFGNSERPDSPFRFASWAEWVRGGLRPAPLSHEAVEKLGISRQLLHRDASEAAACSPPDREDSR